MNLKTKIDIMQLISDQTFQTGTTAYGMPNPTDHDRFCTRSTLKTIIDTLRGNSVEYVAGGSVEEIRDANKDNPTSIVFSHCGERFNVFSVPDDDIEIWKATTSMMSIAYKCQPYGASIKPLRVLLFKQMRDTLSAWRNMQSQVVDVKIGAASAK